jgi:hypothetical protein
MKNLVARNGWWSFRIRVEGRDRWIALGTQDRAAAEQAAGLLQHTAQNERLRQRLGMPPAAGENLLDKLGLLRQRTDVATIGEVFLAYDEANRGRNIEQDSAENAKIYLRHIVRLVKGKGFNVEGAKCSILTDQLLADYVSERRRIRLEVEIPAKLAALRAAGSPIHSEREFRDKELGACQTTVKSAVTQARSIFAADLRQSAPYRRLKLPDLAGFLAKKMEGSTLKSYRRPRLEVLHAIRDGAALLKLQDPGAWLALQLEANGGLRRGSAVDALWDWFHISGPDTVQLQCRRAKGGHTDNAFPWDRYQEMLQLKDGPAFVLPGASREEREGCCGRLLLWLRGRGMDRRLPNHELRKWAVDSRRREHGKDDAQSFAGHSDQKLLKAYSVGSTEKVLRVV